MTALDPTAPVENVNSIPNTTQGPSNTGTTGTDGYSIVSGDTYLVDEPGSISSLPDYVSSVTVTGSGGQYNVGTSTITLGGTTTASGFTYASTSSIAPPADLVTIALTGSVPTTFDLGLLSDNSNISYPTLYAISLYDGNPADGGTQVGPTLDVNTTATTRYADNDFYYASIVGASSGDFLVVQGYRPTNGDADVELGGVTFDTVDAAITIPEPSTYALLFAGLGALALGMRFRRSRA